jgi:hypothetical protein
MPMTRPVSGYAELVVEATPEGPVIVGDIPHHIGVYADLLACLNPDLGTWRIGDGTLTICGVRFRHIGVDGPDVFVFERLPR